MEKNVVGRSVDEKIYLLNVIKYKIIIFKKLICR